ncbi:MAG: VWA domain-containing protein [Chloroflexi bacterium]|nr:VWA domain-containing protein [Chloroflexota bacterium]
MIQECFGLLTRKATPVPLTGVEVTGTVTGRAARVRVRQTFKNIEPDPIEAVYKFPLPEGAALCGFRAVIGARTITGQVKEREEAFKEYDDALAAGHGGYLLDEERPNIFTLSVGNLPPQASAVIEIQYASLLETNGPEVRFSLPTTISPRYLPGRMGDEDGIPPGKIINPDVTLDAKHGLKLQVAIAGKDGVAAVECPSHAISTEFGHDCVLVSFAAGTGAMDRDFVLNIKYARAFENRAFAYRTDHEVFLQADLSSDNADLPADDKQGREIVFLLDCSGSMQGISIAEARAALEIFLRGLAPGTEFNLYRFGSSFDKLFPSSQKYTPDSLDQALRYLSRTDADLGGTEVLAPLADIFARPAGAGSARSIILITDGQIGNEAEILDLVRRQDAAKARLFAVGIGHGPNEYFIKQICRISGGAAEMIAPGERIERT